MTIFLGQSFAAARIALAAAALFAPCLAAAQDSASTPRLGDAELQVLAGFGYSDNLRGTIANEVEAMFVSLGLEGNFEKETRRTFFGLYSDLNYFHYDEDSIDSEPVGSLDALFQFELLEESLTWEFEQNLGSIRSSFTELERPGNRETVSVFTTGPTLRLAVGNRSEISAGFRYSDASYEDSERVDSATSRATLQLDRVLNPTTRFGVDLAGREIDYDGTGVPDLEVLEASLAMSKTLPKGAASLNVGWNELSREGPFPDISGLLLRASWTRDITSRTRFSLSASQEFSDSTELFRNGQLDNVHIRRRDDVAAVSNPLERQSIAFSLSSSRQRMSYGLSGSFSRDDYETLTDLVNDSARLRISISRQLRPRTDVDFSFRYLRREFDNQARTDIDYYGDLRLRQTLSGKISLAFYYQHFNRNSNLSVEDIIEDRVGLTFSYNLVN